LRFLNAEEVGTISAPPESPNGEGLCDSPFRSSWTLGSPIVEPPRAQYGGLQRDNVLAEPRRRFERKPDVTVVDERPTELDYPPSGIV